MGKRHLIFIHGFLENADMWGNLRTRLSAKSHTILTPELAGHGSRASIGAHPTISHFADDIAQQLNWRKGNRAIVVGHSMGGYVAIELCKILGDDGFNCPATLDNIAPQPANKANVVGRIHKNANIEKV